MLAAISKYGTLCVKIRKIVLYGYLRCSIYRFQQRFVVLLQKTYRLGLSANIINLFKSYLPNRSFVIKHDGNTSGKCHASSGVPQGSSFGFLIFLLLLTILQLSNILRPGTL